MLMLYLTSVNNLWCAVLLRGVDDFGSLKRPALYTIFWLLIIPHSPRSDIYFNNSSIFTNIYLILFSDEFHLNYSACYSAFYKKNILSAELELTSSWRQKTFLCTNSVLSLDHQEPLKKIISYGSRVPYNANFLSVG